MTRETDPLLVEIAERIGNQVHRRRNALGWTQEELAEELAVSPEHVRRIEGARSTPSLKLIAQMATLFGCDVSVFLSRTRRRKRKPGRPKGR